MRYLLMVPVWAALLCVLPGCVELAGQRIAWSYDAASDTASVLIFYDGVHDNPGGQGQPGEQQLAEFVRGRNILLLDWFGNWELDRLTAEASAPDAAPTTRPLGEALKLITVQVLGHYREPDGRVGAAQLVRIPKASRLVSALNAALNPSLSVIEPDDDGWGRTQKRIAEAAAAGHAWLALDGHALRLSIPVDQAEWQRGKAAVLSDMFNLDDADRSEPELQTLRMFTQLLAGGAVSYVERAGAVDITIGRPDEPTLLRLDIRDGYKPNLEKALMREVPDYLDKRINDWLLAGGEAPVGLSEIVSFGPPEAQALALIGMHQRADERAKAEALRRLKAFAAAWNDAGRLPEAPGAIEPTADYLQAWREWYRATKAWPLEPAAGDDGDAQPADEAP